MAYQEQRTTGYGTRVGNSFKAIGTGFILFCIGTALLWWNEGRTVKTEKMLEEVGGSYVEMENPNKKDASLDGELICGSALATTEDSLSDNLFGVGAKAIALHRRVVLRKVAKTNLAVRKLPPLHIHIPRNGLANLSSLRSSKILPIRIRIRYSLLLRSLSSMPRM